MKIRITMKDPDTMIETVDEAVKEDVAKLGLLSKDEAEAIIEMRAEAERDKLSAWFRYSEYLTVECDTEAMTARVLTVQEAET